MKKVSLNYRLRPGDLVEIRTANEILRSLDSNGTLDGLPFMPEMLEFCGGRYRVFQRVVQAAIDDETQTLRGFRNNDVVILEELRCSGFDHDGCQRGCMVFWKEAWLSKVEDGAALPGPVPMDMGELRGKLETRSKSGVYFCQSTEFSKATNQISRWRRVGKCISSIQARNCSPGEMLKRLMVWGWWKGRQKLLGGYPRGDHQPTPIEVLDLQPGELVEVKPLAEIVATLDKYGKNRGLHFSPDMLPFCGRQFRVRSRADKLINEITGQMRQLPHTVILEDVLCDSTYYAFGGCPRSDFQYWREIWLKRVE